MPTSDRRTFPGLPRHAIVGVASVLLPACASAPPAPPIPAVDAEQVALQAEVYTRLDEAVRILFDWSIREPDFRASGRGVARIEPPYKARLDLFLDNGEAVAQAALVDSDLRLPDWVPDGIIPPAPLLWASIGVFHPGQEVILVEGQRAGDERLKLLYDVGNGREVRFELEDRRVIEAQLVSDGHVTERIWVGGLHESSFPEESTYRNLGAFRELEVELASVTRVESFPPDIWLSSLR